MSDTVTKYRNLADEKLNETLAVVFGGWKPPGHPDTEAHRVKRALTHSTYRGHWLSPTGMDSRLPSYTTSLGLVMELLSRPELRRTIPNWSISREGNTATCVLEINPKGKPWVSIRETSTYSEEMAVCLALYVAALELGLIPAPQDKEVKL